MPVICVASPKGGVGKTMLSANLAIGLHRLGWRVVAIDFDSQNSLRLHFEAAAGTTRGLATDLRTDAKWSDAMIETQAGVFVIPFGSVPVRAGLSAQNFAIGNPGWVRRQLEAFTEYPDLVVVADLPPGPSAFLDELLQVSSLNLAMLLPDAMGLALLPRIGSGDFFLSPAALGRGTTEKLGRVGYVLNQIDRRRQLCRDVLALSQDMLGRQLMGMIHTDEAIAEAVACQLSVLDYAPESVASYDLAELSRQVDRTLRPV